MKCKYCGTAYDGSQFGEYHDGGCMIEGQKFEKTGGIRSRTKKAADPEVKGMAPVETKVLTPDVPSKSLTEAKKKRGRPRKVVTDETKV